MVQRAIYVIGVAALAVAATVAPAGPQEQPTINPEPTRSVDPATNGSETIPFDIPLSFEPNVGQVAAPARFMARAEDGTFAFTDSEVVMTPAGGDVVRAQFVGASPSRRLVAVDRQKGVVNYLHGRDPTQWRTGVPTYGTLEYVGLYDGVHLAYIGTPQGRLKGTWTVSPGTDPSRIRWRYDRARVRVDAAGDLRISGHEGATAAVVERAPVAWQSPRGQRVAVPARYRVNSDGTVGFALGAYDTTRPLIIDPEVVFSSYLGGFYFDEANDVAVDDAGAVYVTGRTASHNDFPLRSAHQPNYGGQFDAFVTKLSPDGSSLVYSTFFGDGNEDYGNAIDVDADGNAYVAGYTWSRYFPTTPGAYKEAGEVRIDDGFVAKFDPTGSLLYSTLYDEEVEGLAVDAAGNAYLAAHGSRSVPECPGVYDAHVAKVNPTGSALVYSTCFGGGEGLPGRPDDEIDIANDIAVDSAGNAYVTGYTESTDFPTTPDAFQREYAGGFAFGDGFGDAFVTKFDASGSIAYSTFLGGSASEYAWGIAVDGDGSAYVAGITWSPDFPTESPLQATPAGSFDAFVAKLSPDGDSLVYSTYLGGGRAYYPRAPRDEANDIAVDDDGHAWIVGRTDSNDFPTKNPVQPLLGCCVGAPDAFVTELSVDGAQLLFSSFLGGEQYDVAYSVALDGAGNVYVAGAADSLEFPTTTGAFQENKINTLADGFVAKIDPNAGAPFVPDTVEITAAQYTKPSEFSGELEVKATSTDKTATLIVEVTATSHRLGILEGKNGRYSGTFRWVVNPEQITVRSTAGGTATAIVTTK